MFFAVVVPIPTVGCIAQRARKAPVYGNFERFNLVIGIDTAESVVRSYVLTVADCACDFGAYGMYARACRNAAVLERERNAVTVEHNSVELEYGRVVLRVVLPIPAVGCVAACARGCEIPNCGVA